MAEGRGPRIGGALAVGFAAIGLFFVGFGGWAAIAPIERAVVAAGVVGVESERKTIQHLEGGIVRKIFVRDGDRVAAGQVLIDLDDTQSGATLDLLRMRRDTAAARQARLEAERDGRGAIDVPVELRARRADPAVAEILATQTDVFRVRRQALDGQVAIQEARVAQLRSEIAGLEGAIAAEDRELALLTDEIGGLETLFAQRLVAKTRLSTLQRRVAEIEGNRTRNRAAIVGTRQGIDEAQLRIVALRTTATNEAAAQLDEVKATLLDLGERLRAAEDIRRRSAIIAPHAGIVVNRRVHTPGGVVAPGEALLDLVPIEDRLVVEVRIDPIDADVVRPDLDAQIRITAFNQRHARPLRGRVVRVSADRLVDERSGAGYYRAHVELLEDPAADAGTINPGMPAEVIIKAGARTLADYLFEPLTGVFRRALHET